MAPRRPICSRAVAITLRSIVCDVCSNWIHIKCGNVSANQYEEYKLIEEFDWMYPKCKEKPEPPKTNNINPNDTEADSIACQVPIITEETKLAFAELSKDIKKYRGLSIAHININRLYPKLSQIKVLLEETSIDILAISETHQHSGISDDEVKIENYELLRRDRVNDTGWGGVLIYHKETLNGIEYEICVNDLEMLWLECTVKSQKILVSCLYQPPRDKATFLDKFDQIISLINEKRTNFIILGDFDIDLIGDANSAVLRFNLLLKKHQLCNIIKEPTRITETSITLIDHILLY